MSRKRIALIIAALLLVLLFIARWVVISYAINRLQATLKETYNATLLIEDVHQNSLTGVAMNGLTLIVAGNDTLLHANQVSASLRLLSLLRGHIRLSSIELSNARLNLRANDSTSNYAGFFRRETKPAEVQTKETLEARANLLLAKFFDALPSHAVIDNLALHYTNDDEVFQADSLSATLAGNAFSVQGIVRENLSREKIFITGNVSRAEQTAQLRIFADKRFYLPFAEERFKTRVEFDTLAFDLATHHAASGLTISGSVRTANLSIFNERLDAEPLDEMNLQSRYTIKVSGNTVEVDSTTKGNFGEIPFTAFLRYDKQDSAHITLNLSTDTTDAEDFFQALPQTLLSEIKGYRFTGKLAYQLFLDIDFRNLDSLQLSSTVSQRGWGAASLGRINFSALNEPFEHNAYENGNLVRTFTVGAANPAFTPLASMPKHLVGAVLTNEDGGFFLHRGFNEESFAGAIADNLRKGRFARGGSTITMQLVKNLYLSQKKTVSRKFQEVLIVWLLERSGIVSKERLLEIYLNIIEFGPRIYGIGEATQFYFGKRPSDVTVAEALWLASIIPSPKRFMRTFDDSGNLRDSQISQMKFVAGKMVGKGYLQDAAAISYDIKLTGAAKALLKTKDDKKPDDDDSF
jgi:hypothetical protein